MPEVVIAIAAALLGGLAGVAITRRVWQQKLEEERIHTHQIAAQLREAEAAQTQTSSRELLGEVAYNALILVDTDRRILHMNATAHSLFDHSGIPHPDEAGTLIAVTRNHELDDAVTETLHTGEGVDLQLTVHGSTYRVRTLLAGSGEERVVALALQDVSELQRLGRARRDMVANISHELRTPITSIRLLVDTLEREDACGKKRGRRLLKKITTETDTLEQMAQELLDLAMIESGRAEFIMKPADIGQIVVEAVEQFAEQAERKQITLHAAIPEGLQVLADAHQVRRVLGNLLHNAIKFTPMEGTVSIEVEPGAEWLTLSVTDTGPGIPADERDRVFERFYRGDRARGGGGTGLGLAIAKHIVQAHGGRIWAEEPPEYPGARICFTLPTADE